jgi:hypothetical protein
VINKLKLDMLNDGNSFNPGLHCDSLHCIPATFVSHIKINDIPENNE